MRKSKQIAGLLLLMALCLAMAVGCGEVRIVAEESEILAAARDLTERSILWNKLFYIDGIPTLEGGRTTGIYQEADPDFLAELGMERLSDIKEYAAGIYSTEMMQTFEQTLFSAIHNGQGTLVSGTVCMDYNEIVNGKSTFVCLMVNTENCPAIKTDEVVYLYDTMRVVYNLNYRATVEIAVCRVGEEQGQTATIRINLLKTEDTWYLDNNTFARLPEPGEP
jgi:hypothetical protein